MKVEFYFKKCDKRLELTLLRELRKKRKSVREASGRLLSRVILNHEPGTHLSLLGCRKSISHKERQCARDFSIIATRCMTEQLKEEGLHCGSHLRLQPTIAEKAWLWTV